MEGKTWSVSEKYIQACDSMLLLVKAEYYEFFSRSLLPLKHYWPINPSNLCQSIKFAVNWGNKHPVQVHLFFSSFLFQLLFLFFSLFKTSYFYLILFIFNS